MAAIPFILAAQRSSEIENEINTINYDNLAPANFQFSIFNFQLMKSIYNNLKI
jgi:hypothetical protein